MSVRVYTHIYIRTHIQTDTHTLVVAAGVNRVEIHEFRCHHTVRDKYVPIHVRIGRGTFQKHQDHGCPTHKTTGYKRWERGDTHAWTLTGHNSAFGIPYFHAGGGGGNHTTQHTEHSSMRTSCHKTTHTHTHKHTGNERERVCVCV